MPDQKLSTPSLGVCYYPEHWDETRWPTDLQRMGSLGIRYVRVAEFAWSRFEPEPERFEFSWLQRFLDLAKKKDSRWWSARPPQPHPSGWWIRCLT